ncbi:hypothetical protein [Streptosporangium carneum]|uniref:Uncharacterized protein n=1 Tax=Streptosporangium carneum TaxID=47481 RepID=A0A9W6HYV3_9ACTN|nr:hypothetical protein [Streptosporangium carneum]GLK08910.1 hypothetical protein GCM10017600_23150 [Streptosporangium carneum]
MGLSAWLTRYAAARPRPLVVTAPHATRLRLLAEAELARRGWRGARSPAGADLLVVCGTPAAALSRAVEVVWTDVPAPRTLVELRGDPRPELVTTALDGAVDRLADVRSQRLDAAGRAGARDGRHGPAQPYDEHDGEHDDGEHHAEHGRHGEQGGQEHHGGHGGQHDQHSEHGGHGRHGEQGGQEHHGGHGGQHDRHGGHGHHMGNPGGVPMAERGRDRDGLTLDRLHVPLGPVLSDWPAGLVVETVLQGDVIQQARVEVAGGLGTERFWDAPWLAALEGRRVTRGEAARRGAASRLDSVGRLLAVAGWGGAATEARRLRDRLLWERRDEGVPEEFAGFARRVRRSWLLHWMLRGLGTPGLSPGRSRPGRDGVAARLDAWLDETGRALNALDDGSPLDDDAGPRGPVGDRPSEALLSALPGLLTGTELAAARLVVAGLDPDLDQVRPAREASHA